MWMSQSCFKQLGTAFLENALPGGLPVNLAVASDRHKDTYAGSEHMAVVPQEHAMHRAVSRHLNVERVLKSWKDSRLMSVTEDADKVRSSLSSSV